MPATSIDTPTGRIAVFEEDGCIVRILWTETGHDDASALLAEAAAQIAAYFRGTRQTFDLPLRVEGGAFQLRVCDAMSAIPFGETRTYGDLARNLGTMPQPIGQACGGNPIPIVIPCHRVLGANGIGGFSGGEGVETKVALLRHEGAWLL